MRRFQKVFFFWSVLSYVFQSWGLNSLLLNFHQPQHCLISRSRKEHFMLTWFQQYRHHRCFQYLDLPLSHLWHCLLDLQLQLVVVRVVEELEQLDYMKEQCCRKDRLTVLDNVSRQLDIVELHSIVEPELDEIKWIFCFS